MITGCEKRVIVVKNTGSDVFEEAYFIVNKGTEASRSDFLYEANRIIGSKNVEIRKRKRRLFAALLAPICFLSGAGFAFLAIFLFA